MNFVDAILKTVTLILSVATVTADGNTTGVDVETSGGGFDGPVLGILTTGAGGSAATLDAKLQHSDTQGGTYTDVVNGAFAQQGNAIGVATCKVDGRALKRWVRVSDDIAGTASFARQVTLTGVVKYT